VGFDFLLAVALAAFTWRLAYLGVRVTLHPIRNEERKKRLKREFTFIGFVSVVMIGMQAYRASAAYSSLIGEIRKNQNASITLGKIVLTEPFVELSMDSRLAFNLDYNVTSNTAKDVRSYDDLWLEDSAPNGNQDREVLSRFRVEAAKHIPEHGDDRGPSSGNWSTVHLNLYGQSASDIVAGKRTVYLLGRVEWNNPSGSDSHLDVCEWIQQPKSDILFKGGIVWHNCKK